MSANLSLEQRIQRLEDVEAIKKIQATYGHYVNRGWNDKVMFYKKVTAMFTEDATWEAPAMGVLAQGRGEISEMFEDMSASNEFFMHSFSNPIIDIGGDTAKAQWLLLLGGNFEDKTTLTYASYDNDYVRTSQGWLIKAIRLYIARVLEAS
ncbi:MAG: nuclear transport factor 2 family protein [Syntrophales bacterium]|jgi:ketosteroid isomerase-like protein